MDSAAEENKEANSEADSADTKDKDKVDSTAKDKDLGTEKETENIEGVAGNQSTKAGNVTFKATYGADAGIPEDAELVVKDVKDTSKYLEGVKEALNVDSIDNAQFYDIHFEKDKKEIEVKGNVTITATLNDDAAINADSKVNVLHFPDGSYQAEVLGNVEVSGGKQKEESTDAVLQTQNVSPKRLMKAPKAKTVQKADESSVVTFTANSFSVYAITETEDTSKTKEYRRTYTFQNDDGSNYNFNLEPNPASESNTTTNQQIVKNGEQLKDVGTPNALLPEDVGHEFLGWGVVTKASDETETVNKSNLIQLPITVTGIKSADESVTLRAVFSDAVNLTFYDSDNKTIIYKEKVAKVSDGTNVDLSNYHATAEIPASSEQMIKSFVGWSTEKNASTALPDNYKADTDTEFYPVYKEGYWLYFNANDGDSDVKASFTESVFVEKAQTLKSTKPTQDPTRTGYAFKGWYTDSNCTSPFTWGTTLKGNTTLYAKWEPATANYTIVFWLQNANDNNYSYAGQSSKSGTTGTRTAYTVNNADLPQAISSISQYLDLNNTDHEIQQKTIKGDGSTIVNVYYDRKTFTLRFYYAASQSSYSSTTYYVPEFTNRFSESNADSGSRDVGNALNANTKSLWNTDPNSLPELSTKYIGCYQDEGNYRWYYFDIKGKYGENISDSWPNSPFSTSYRGHSFISWGTRNGTNYYRHHDNKNIKGLYEKIDSDLVGTNNNGVEGTVSDDTAVFLAYWNNPHTYTYHIYYSPLDGQTGGSTFTYNGNTYSNYIEQREVSVNSSDPVTGQNNLSFEGVNPVNATPIEVATRPNENGGDVTFLYTRNNHKITFNTKNGIIAIDENIPYGEELSKENIVNQHKSDAEAVAQANYRFVGWTTDPNGEGELFQFSGPMPDNDIVLYAKYEPITHNVTFDPDGGTIPGNDSGKTYTENVLLNNSITNATRSTVLQTTKEDSEGTQYTLVGWYKVNSDGTETLYNFGDAITEDITLKAHWRQSGEYYVRYIDSSTEGRATNTPQNIDDVEYADQSNVGVLAYPADWTAPDGKVFAGWTYEGKTYFPGETLTMDASKAEKVTDGASGHKYITLEAQYTKLGTTYIVYDANGGRGSLTDPDKISNNIQANVPLNATTTLSKGSGFTREGYVLAGWDTEVDGTGTRWNLGEKVGVNDDKDTQKGGMPDGGNKLYAVWAPIQKLKKVDNGTGTNQKTLSGATFKLTRIVDNVDQNVTRNDFYGDVTINDGNEFTVTSDNNGMAEIGALKQGSYKLTEIDAPSGYIVQASNVEFTVDNKGVVTFRDTADVSYDSVNFTFTIINKPGEKLPETGGHGTLPYTVGGLLIVIAAGVFYIISKKRSYIN